MAEYKSVFQPIDQAGLTGPFQGYLRPPEQQAPGAAASEVPGHVSSLGGMALVAGKFLEGATKGRIKAFEQKENEKLQKKQTLDSYVSSIVNNPDLTDEAKQFATQQYYRAMGAEVLDNVGTGGKGKGGKGKSDEQGGMGHHFTNILKDVATGMVGGKAPKGGADVGNAVVSIQQYLYGQDGKIKPEFNRPGQIDATLGTMRSALPDPNAGTLEEASKAIAQHLPNLRRLAGPQADAHISDMLRPYQAAPAVGSEAWAMQQFTKQQGGQGGQPAPPPGPPSVIPTASGLAQESANQPVGQAGPPPGPPAGQPTATGPRPLSPTEFMIAGFLPKGAIGELENLEYDGPDGKPIRVQAREVHIPGRDPAYYDASNHPLPVDASKIRGASTAQPRQPSYTHGRGTADKDMTAKDGTPIKKGQLYDWRQSNDEGSKREVMGLGVQPPPPRPFRGQTESAAMKALNRKIEVADAIGRIIEKTGASGGLKDAKGNPLEGSALARAIGDHARQYFKDDPGVKGHLKEIMEWVSTEARKGSLKGDLTAWASGQSEKLQNDKSHLQTQDNLQHLQDKLDDLDEDTRGDIQRLMQIQTPAQPPGGGGGMVDIPDH